MKPPSATVRLTKPPSASARHDSACPESPICRQKVDAANAVLMASTEAAHAMANHGKGMSREKLYLLLELVRRLKPSPYLLGRVLLAVALRGYRGHSEVIVSLLAVRVMRNFPSEYSRVITGLVYVIFM